MDAYLTKDKAESKHDRKIKKTAQKLFSKQLLKIKQDLDGFPIDLSFEHNRTESNWKNNRNKQYHWLFNFRRLSKTAEVESILSFWDHYDARDRAVLKPLLDNLIELKQSSASDRALARGRINEEMYVMF